jgi:UDP-2,4-diacetamido-2,4,6-trideoxy-beta-L-altropyranose hydrolase
LAREPDRTPPAVPALAGAVLTIRTDAGPGIGLGHAMRCLALAEAWRAAGGAIRLACNEMPPSIADRYRDAGAEVAEPGRRHTAGLIRTSDAVVVDGLHMDDSELREAAGTGAVLLTIDDMAHRAHYPGDLLLNQNVHATPALYDGRTGATLCLGPDWCLLRREFRERIPEARPPAATVRRVLVLTGGADPHGFTRLLLEGVARATAGACRATEIVVVVGAANPARPAVERQAIDTGLPVAVLQDVRDMPGLMLEADLAVSAAGTTALELAALGVPMILGAQNASETAPGAAFGARGAAVYLGPLAELTVDTVSAEVAALVATPDRRRELSASARRLVDGRGADRVVAALAAKLGRQGSTP